MDRELSRRNVLRGLAIGGLAVSAFGLTFLLSVFYIA